MRKINYIIILLLLSYIIKAQNYAPSFINFINNPISVSSGAPEINIPLYNLQTKDPNFSIGINFMYHPTTVTAMARVEDVGLGWTLFNGGGSVFKDLDDGLPDEYSNGNNDYPGSPNNDIYYYNFCGYSGKFQIQKDNSGYHIIKMSPDNLIIDYTRNNKFNNCLAFDTLTFTDDRGYKYFFDVKGINYKTFFEAYNWTYNNNFYLTKITNPQNVEIVSYTYQEFNKLRYDETHTETCTVNIKLKEIDIKDIGKIQYTYAHPSYICGPFCFDDSYPLLYISFADNNGNTIEYEIEGSSSSTYFDYVNMEYKLISKGVLGGITKYVNGFKSKDSYSFGYNDFSPSYPRYGDSEFFGTPDDFLTDPKYVLSGVINRIYNPLYGVTKYNFGVHRKYINKNTAEYISQLNNATSNGNFFDKEIQFMKKTDSLNFDLPLSSSYPPTDTYVLDNISRNKWIYFHYESQVYPIIGSDDPYYYQDPTINFDLYKNGVLVAPKKSKKSSNEDIVKLYHIDNTGNYTFKVKGNRGAHGQLVFYEIGMLSPPYRNDNPYIMSGLNNKIRIESIEKYGGYNNDQLLQKINYDYSNINEANNPSSLVIEQRDYDDAEEYMYKNVKIFQDNNGYTQYTFKTPSEFPQPYDIDVSNSFPNHTSSKYYPSEDIIKNGTLLKQEVYDNDSKKISETNYTYSFEEIEPMFFFKSVNDSPNKYISYFTKNSFIKTNKEVTTNYYEGGGSSTTTIENTNSSNNFLPLNVKSTSPDGTIKEIVYQYAYDINNQKLKSANIVGVPLAVKKKENGNIISKTETKYENTSNYYPSSIVEYNQIDGSSKTTIRYDQYDVNGNLVQYTLNPSVGGGIPVTIVWGYHNTKPIAKIEGLKYSDVSSYLGNIVSLSDIDADATNQNALTAEAALLTALNNFRKNDIFKTFPITTFTYDSSKGITNIISSNGIKETKIYNERNKLKYILDNQGNIILENKEKENNY